MEFGFAGCHSSVPSLQKMAVYSAEALEALEAAILPERERTSGAKTVAKRKRNAVAV